MENKLKDYYSKLKDCLLKCNDSEFRAQSPENLFKSDLYEFFRKKNECDNIKENMASVGKIIEGLNEVLNNTKKGISGL